jgi:hypothetical protein
MTVRRGRDGGLGEPYFSKIVPFLMARKKSAPVVRKSLPIRVGGDAIVKNGVGGSVFH